MTAAGALQTSESVSSADTDAVLALVARSADADGFAALNEAASLRLRHSRPGTRHLLVRAAGEVVGYGQVELPPLRQAQGTEGGPAQGTTGGPALSTTKLAHGALVVDPRHRRRGLGTMLLRAMIEASEERLEIWATRNTSAAQALAARVGLIPVRQLLIMNRSLAEPVAVADLPAGLAIRSFRPGRDEESWLAVNARAFAHHPEQGGITHADLQERMSESWFDPEGFLVAENEAALRQAQDTGRQAQDTGRQAQDTGRQAQDTGRQAQDTDIVGFHWTKQHPDQLGEVYVLGVDPAAGARGLGRALLTAGLAHLRRAGNRRVQLYTEAENTRAVALYERNGFTIASTDVMYAGPNAGFAPLATMHVSSDPA